MSSRLSHAAAIAASIVAILSAQTLSQSVAHATPRIASDAAIEACSDNVTSAANGRRVNIFGNVQCGHGAGQAAEAVPKPGDTRILPCDPTGTGTVNKQCGDMNACLTDARIAAPPLPGWHVEQRQILDTTGQWSLYGTGCRQEQPGLDPQLIKDQIAQLAPHTDIKAAPPNGQTLVNIQTIYWLDTPPSHTYGPLTLLGHTLTITLYADSATWTFGDGTHTTSNGPGRPFTEHDHCHTPQCPDWFGHTYTTTSTNLTITATPHWSATYTLDGQDPHNIPGTIDSPTTTLPMRVQQARSVLVPVPVPIASR